MIGENTHSSSLKSGLYSLIVMTTIDMNTNPLTAKISEYVSILSPTDSGRTLVADYHHYASSCVLYSVVVIRHQSSF